MLRSLCQLVAPKGVLWEIDVLPVLDMELRRYLRFLRIKWKILEVITCRLLT